MRLRFLGFRFFVRFRDFTLNYFIISLFISLISNLYCFLVLLKFHSGMGNVLVSAIWFPKSTLGRLQRSKFFEIQKSTSSESSSPPIASSFLLTLRADLPHITLLLALYFQLSLFLTFDPRLVPHNQLCLALLCVV